MLEIFIMIFITFTKNKHVKEINSLDTENKKSLTTKN